MPTRTELLDRAGDVLRRGEPLTLDSVAREAGLTKAGVVHHFPTKEQLALGVVDHIVDGWERELAALVAPTATPRERLRAYVEYSLTTDFDSSDLAVFADVRLRDVLKERWTARFDAWTGASITGSAQTRAAVHAARLLADGAWFNSALGLEIVADDEKAALLGIALGLLSSEGAA